MTTEDGRQVRSRLSVVCPPSSELVRLGRFERPLNALSTHSLCRLGSRGWVRFGRQVGSATLPGVAGSAPHRQLKRGAIVERTGTRGAAGPSVAAGHRAVAI